MHIFKNIRFNIVNEKEQPQGVTPTQVLDGGDAELGADPGVGHEVYFTPPSLRRTSSSISTSKSSREKTLSAGLGLSTNTPMVGVPIVLGYTVWVYRAFKGKVDISSESNHY